MKLDKNQLAFFALVKAGLWEDIKGDGEVLKVNSFPLTFTPSIDFSEVFRISKEQTVVGLVAAGLEHFFDVIVSKEEVLQFVGGALQLEQNNLAMNNFIKIIVDKMHEAGIFALLLKGQGLAQCYSKPLWRSCGDIDLFFDEANYRKAKDYLVPLASTVEEEDKHRLHLGMTIGSWVVELHGTMRTAISRKVDKEIDAIQRSVFENREVRIWKNGDSSVYLPNADNDAILVFTHFLKHFYVGGVGLRQICDLCRLLWIYRKDINRELLGNRLEMMSLMTEWKAFAAFAVIWLGMPVEGMPFYDCSNKYRTKANSICKLILEAGNFGQKKDISYRSRYSGLVYNLVAFWRRFGEFLKVVVIFPENAPKFFWGYLFDRLKMV